MNWGKIICFVGGTVFGSAGFKVLASKDAKKVYTHTVAAGLRAKDSLMETAENIRENWDDIYADAVEINEKREAEEAAEIIEDASVAEGAEKKSSGKRGPGRPKKSA